MSADQKATNSTSRPGELDMVRVRGRNEPGTVVHIYPHHLAYEVEFADGVVTVDAEHVEGVAVRFNEWL